ncbi:MAG: LytTR family DNA-binding domain-containing protein [Ekhidna sp.]
MRESDILQVVVVDDESLAREAILHYLNEDDRFCVVEDCSDGQSALKAIHQHQPQLVLLDIEMPELNGIEVAKQLKYPFPYLVFITAFEEYAITAFEENAIDYLLKPLNKERFAKMLDRVYEQWTLKQSIWDESKTTLLAQLNTHKSTQYLKKITSKHKGMITLIPVESIYWIESQGSFSKVHLEGKTELTNLSVKQLEEVLDPGIFVRVHKSFMVNIDHIESLESYFHGEYILHLTNRSQVKLSRGYKSNLDRILNQYN